MSVSYKPFRRFFFFFFHTIICYRLRFPSPRFRDVFAFRNSKTSSVLPRPTRNQISGVSPLRHLCILFSHINVVSTIFIGTYWTASIRLASSWLSHLFRTVVDGVETTSSGFYGKIHTDGHVNLGSDTYELTLKNKNYVYWLGPKKNNITIIIEWPKKKI